MTTSLTTSSRHERAIALNEPHASFLRTVLKLDALASGLTGVLLLATGGIADAWLGMSSTLLWGVGAFFVVYAAAVWAVSVRQRVARITVGVIAALNALWALDSLITLLSGWISPTGPGLAFVIFQAVVVGAFAELQYIGLRRLSKV